MIKENQAEFEKANILKYQQLPIKKDVGAIVILDSNNRPRKNHNAEIVLDYFRKDDKSGHNTRVVGITREVAPDARIITFNWFGSYKKQTIDWIIEHKDEIAVINCSFSGTPDSDEQLKRLNGLQIPIIFASGNDYKNDDMNHEAKWDFTISFGAFNEAKNNVENNSNGDELLDAVAFTWIYESVTDTKNHWFPDTSGAAPVASAMLWLYMSRSGQKFSLEQARTFIWRNTIDLYEKGHDNRSGYGLFILPEKTTVNLYIGSESYLIDGVTHRMDTAPILKSKRTFVPIRFVAEALGFKVTWGGDIAGGNKKEVIIQNGNLKVNMLIGSSNYRINDNKSKMDVKPFLQNNRTYVPIRFVAEALGAKVTWGGDIGGNRNEIIIEMEGE